MAIRAPQTRKMASLFWFLCFCVFLGAELVRALSCGITTSFPNYVAVKDAAAQQSSRLRTCALAVGPTLHTAVACDCTARLIWELGRVGRYYRRDVHDPSLAQPEAPQLLQIFGKNADGMCGGGGVRRTPRAPPHASRPAARLRKRTYKC